jgi:hypothetical protein
LLMVVLLGRLDLSVYVIFGALTGVFGRADAHWLRFQHLVFAGALMSASVATGAAVAIAEFGPWSVIVSGVGLAATLSVVSDRWDLRPAGPFFYLFAFTTTAGVPFDGQWWEAVMAAASSAAVVVLFGFSGVLYTRRWKASQPQQRQAHLLWPAVLARATRYAVAVGAAGGVAIAAGLGHYNWAMLAATAPIAAVGLARAVNRAIHIVVGTYVGVALSAVLLMVDWTPLGLVLLLAVLQFANEFYAVRHYSLALVFLTPVALLMTGLVVATPVHQLVYDRVVETTIGAALALFLLLVTHKNLYLLRSTPPSPAPIGQAQPEVPVDTVPISVN